MVSVQAQFVPQALLLAISMPPLVSPSGSNSKRTSSALKDKLIFRRRSIAAPAATIATSPRFQDSPGHPVRGDPIASEKREMPVYRLYPQVSTHGRKELRAMDSKGEMERPPTSASASVKSATRSKSTERRGSDIVAEPLVHDFQSMYNSKPTVYQPSTAYDEPHALSSAESEHPVSPDVSDVDDGLLVDRSGARDWARRSVQLPRSNEYIKARPASRSRQRGRKDSNSQPTPSMPNTPDTITNRHYNAGDRSSADSIFSQETSATSIHTLPPLQSKGPDNSDAHLLEPVMEDDPRSFDLVAPHSSTADRPIGFYMMERRSEQLFSQDHLRAMFDDPRLLLKFTGFLNSHRPQSIPILIYYLDALKALRAIEYANAIAEALDPIRSHAFTADVPSITSNPVLQAKANHAFDVLVRDDLPAYIAHVWIQVVSVSIQRRITGTLAPHLREASEGLAEVFCLTDPSRPDNPIVFASDEFARTTQYGMSYTIGRNCRFLQGPKTRRLAEACVAGKELTEVMINYRRDGSPFMNLLMIAPLMDSKGTIRYYIGAQVDVSGLIKDCSDLDGLARVVEKEQDPDAEDDQTERNDEFQDLCEMFNGAEMETVRKRGGRMHKEYADDSSDNDSVSHSRQRLVLKDPSQDVMDRNRDSVASTTGIAMTPSTVKDRFNGKLEGVYQHYLLVRPAPSLRILFTSPSLRVPGILQSPFLNRVGGSPRVRSDLVFALSEGRGVTAKIRWLTKADEEGEGEGRPRWIHCTPLLGHSGAVGVWMIILVDEEGAERRTETGRRFRAAPPVASNIGGQEWTQQQQASASSSRERQNLNAYDKDAERKGRVIAGGSDVSREYYPNGDRRPALSVNDQSGSASRSASTQSRKEPIQTDAGSEFSFRIK